MVIRILVLPISIVAAILAQLTGYSGNCSQGSTDGWLAGAFTSLPFFFIIALLALATITLRNAKRPRLDRLAYGLVGVGSLGLVIGNMRLLQTVLVQGVSLCGAEFGAASREDTTITVIYCLFPLLTAVLAFWAARRVRPFATTERE